MGLHRQMWFLHRMQVKQSLVRECWVLPWYSPRLVVAGLPDIMEAQDIFLQATQPAGAVRQQSPHLGWPQLVSPHSTGAGL